MRLEYMMYRNISVIMLIMASLFAKAQNFNTITRVVYEQQRISGYNSLNKLSAQVDCKDMVWQVLPDNSIKIWDDIHSFTVFSTTLTVPAFAALGDSLRAWQVSCGQSSTPFPTNLDTTHIDTSLILPTLISNFSVNNNDTLSAILQTIKTIDVADTSNLWMINEVYNQLGLINARAYDTSQVDTSMIEPFIIESFSIRNNDTLSAILQEIKKVDSVYVVNRDTAIVKVVGMKDTLYTYDLDTSVVYAIDSTYYTQLDSIITLLKDTIDFEYNTICYRSKADSGVYQFSVVFDVKTPNIPYYMSFFDVDSLMNLFEFINGVTTGTAPNFATDYVPCERWNEYLSSTKQDTLCFTGEIAVSDSLLRTTVLQGTVNSTNSNTAIVVSERPQVAQFGAVADLVTSHTTSSVIPTASTLEVIVENIGTASTTITYQGVNMPLDVKQQRVFHAIWDEARRIYSPIGTLVVDGTASATIVVIIKNPQ